MLRAETRVRVLVSAAWLPTTIRVWSGARGSVSVYCAAASADPQSVLETEDGRCKKTGAMCEVPLGQLRSRHKPPHVMP